MERSLLENSGERSIRPLTKCLSFQVFQRKMKWGTFERSSCGGWTGRIFCQIVNCKMTTRLSFQFFNDSQQKCGKGLDEIHPFSDTTAVDVLLRETDQFFSPVTSLGITMLGKYGVLYRSSWCWTGLPKVYPGLLLHKETFSSDYIGTASKVGIFLTNIWHFYISYEALGAKWAQPSNKIGWKIPENMGRMWKTKGRILSIFNNDVEYQYWGTCPCCFESLKATNEWS